MSYSEDNTYEKILSRALENDRLVDMDKRPGSIAYDALAPLCLELANAYALLDVMSEQTYLMTATGANLDSRVYDYGLSRKTATKSLRVGVFKRYKVDGAGNFIFDDEGNKILVDMNIPIGSRFTVASEDGLTFEYIGKENGMDILECEQAGQKGDSYQGLVLPIVPIQNLAKASVTDIYTPGSDEETDEELRLRTKNYICYAAYGGNIQDYIERTNKIYGVGNTKVFPAWKQNGSVLLSVVAPSYDPVSDVFIAKLKNEIDPEEKSGEGVGVAPIGHYVTVTTPVKKLVDVSVEASVKTVVDEGEFYERVQQVLEYYLLSVRKQFAQDVKLSVYTGIIIQKLIQEIPEIITVDTVLLNGKAENVVYVDEGEIGMQYLPYLGTLTVNGNIGAGNGGE